MKESVPKIIIPYKEGDVIFKIVGDLEITDKIDIHLADHPNIKFRYMNHYNKVCKHLRKLEKQLENFKAKVCVYWARFLMASEGIEKETKDNLDCLVRRVWSDEVVSDEDECQEYVDMAMGQKYFNDYKKKMDDKIRDKILNQMFPQLDNVNEDILWFRGLETEEAEIEKWRGVKEDLEISIECLKDKGYALGSLKDLKIEGMVDLYSARSRLKDQVNGRFNKKNN